MDVHFGMAAHVTRFPIRFSSAFRGLFTLLMLRPANSFVDVGERYVTVRMAWSFHAHFPRAAVASTSLFRGTTLSRGVHGWAGRWLVNGSGDRILVIDLEPAQRASVLGFPVRLQQLMV